VDFPSLKLPIGISSLSLESRSLIVQSAKALLTALLLLLSFPGFDFNLLAWIALVPLLQVIASGVTTRRALWLGWLAGVVFTFFAENWIAHSMTHFGEMLTVIAYAVALLFAAILAIFPAIFAAALSRLVRRFGWRAIALAPFIWVATEYLRPMITGVTWNALGVSQAEHFTIAKLSRYGGVYLISAEVVAVSALTILMLRIKDRGVARAAGLLLLIAAAILMLPGTSPEAQPLAGAEVTVVGVQPNLPPDSVDAPEAFSSDLENSIRLTREGIARTPDKTADLVVWAESPLALFYEDNPGLRRRIDALAVETGSYLIINTVAREGESYFNSVQTVGPGTGIAAGAQNGSAPGPLKRYDKMRLVPFGEYVPWQSILSRFVPTIVGDFTPGRQAVVNNLRLKTRRAAIISGNEISPAPALERTTNFIRVGAFICYEAAYPDTVRQFVSNGATLLVNISNDAWFGTTAGARQHLKHAIIRAVENDRDLIRVTNTGISTLITAKGQVVDPLPVFTAASQTWSAQARHSRTFYMRHGDWFAIGCLSMSLLIFLFSLLSARQEPIDRTH
jgi:apolipoprotein N-acyltransferase